MRTNYLTLLSLLAAGCVGVPNEKIYCQDESGKPVEGAILVCDYQHTNNFPEGTNYYISDINGVWYATNDNITRNARSAPRNYLFVYSEKLHSGGLSTGLPNDVLQDQNLKYYSINTIRTKQQENSITVFRDGSEDPIIWLESLNNLHKMITPSGLYWGGEGKDVVRQKLINIYKREFAELISKYGNYTPSEDYIIYYNIAHGVNNGNRKFGDTCKKNFESKIPVL